MVASIFCLSLRTVPIIFFNDVSFFSTLCSLETTKTHNRHYTTHLSIMLITFGLIFFFIPFCASSSSVAFVLSLSTSLPSKSYKEPAFPNCLQIKTYNISINWNFNLRMQLTRVLQQSTRTASQDYPQDEQLQPSPSPKSAYHARVSSTPAQHQRQPFSSP